MPLDGLFLYGINRELNDLLSQGRIEKIYQPAREEIVLTISKPGAKHRLLLNGGAENARVHLTSLARPNPASPPMFCMLLRKHLEGGRIIEFRQSGWDRVLDIRVDCRDELGQPVVKSLLCEIMGRHSNIILVSRAGDLILDGIRRYSHAVSRHREVLPGRVYLPPPEQGKADPFALTEDIFRTLLMSGDLDSDLATVIQRSIGGFSIPTCRELVMSAGMDREIGLEYCGEHEMRALWQTLQKTLAGIRQEGVRATLLYHPDGAPADFFPLEPAYREGQRQLTGTANQIADTFFTAQFNRLLIAKEKSRLLGVLKKHSRRISKKLRLQQQSTTDAGEGDAFRLYGELLTSFMHLVKKGMTEIALDNYHHPAGEKIIILLNPELNGSENAQAYFKKYAKAKNTGEAAARMAALSEEELHYLEGVAAAVEMAQTMDDLEEIKLEIRGQGYLKEPVIAPRKSEAKKARPHSEPLRFVSGDGFTILVGKNNRQNDHLTFKIAGEQDIWMHTSKIPGSHVIIRTEGREAPLNTLRQAAALAANFSRAKGSSNVPVDYTQRKNVKKPSGARPGFVIYEKQKTLYADPAPDISSHNLEQ
ncbi:MAG: NFACT family protein [Firmicutes bacterium]|nr:NFACT family protein [Bacillota bacterium]